MAITYETVLSLFDKYSLPKDPLFSERLQYLLYRVWNAIKNVFARSDWQVFMNLAGNTAVAALQNHSTLQEREIKSEIENRLTTIFHNYKEAHKNMPSSQFALFKANQDNFIPQFRDLYVN